jgi:ketosteroid isomerase-like protein
VAESGIDTLRRGIERSNNGDFDGMVELVTEDVVIQRPGGQGEIHGRAALREFMEPDAFESIRFEPQDMAENGDRVYAKMHITARGRTSGLEVDQVGYHVWTMRDGHGVRLEVFEDEAEARRAAGLA